MPLKIEKLTYGGKGLGFVNGLAVFVPQTVPEDEIEFEITERHASYLEGRMTKLLKPSEDRINPKCEYFGRCGGCQWQHINYNTQLLWKQLIVKEQLHQIAKMDSLNILPTIPSPKIWNYRSRIKLHKDKTGCTGFYAAGSHKLIEIINCPIADSKANSNSSDFFTQVNPYQNEILKEKIVEFVKSAAASCILELYCGNGNLTFPLTNIANNIIAVDSSRKAINFAVKEANKLHTENVRFICQSAKAVVNQFAKRRENVDCVLLDPPRDGAKDIIRELARLKPRTIIYISCNPSTLARDVASLAKLGDYKLQFIQPIDMFPQTYHIESIALLSTMPPEQAQ